MLCGAYHLDVYQLESKLPEVSVQCFDNQPPNAVFSAQTQAMTIEADGVFLSQSIFFI